MSLDEPTANDAALIDDDLVMALGFEPTADPAEHPGHESDLTNDSGIEVVPGDDDVRLITDLAPILADESDDQASGDSGPTDSAPTEEPMRYRVVLTDEVSVAEAPILDDSPVLEAEPLLDDELDDEPDKFTSVDDVVVDEDLLEELQAEPLFGEAAASAPSAGDDLDVDPAVAADLDPDGSPDTESDYDDSRPTVDHLDIDEAAADDVVVIDDHPVDDVIDLDADTRRSDGAATEAVEPVDLGTLDRHDVSVWADEAPSTPPPLSPATEAVPIAATAAGPLSAPAAVPAGRRGRKLRARKVRRVVRHIDPWSVLTFSVLFHLVFFAAFLLASVIVWNAAVAAGTIDNIESFIRELGDYQTFNIDGGAVFKAAMTIAGLLTLASSILVVLLTVVFNLVSDLVGGIRITVVEEDNVLLPETK